MIRRIVYITLALVALTACHNEEKPDHRAFPQPVLPNPTNTVVFFRIPELYESNPPLDAFAVVRMPDQSLQQVSFSMQPKVHMARGWYTNKAVISENTNDGWPATPGSMQITITIWPFQDANHASPENVVSNGASTEPIGVDGLAAVRTEYLDTQNNPSEGFVITAKIDDAFYVMFQVQMAIGEKDKFEGEALEIINTFQVTDIQPYIPMIPFTPVPG